MCAHEGDLRIRKDDRKSRAPRDFLDVRISRRVAPRHAAFVGRFVQDRQDAVRVTGDEYGVPVDL